MVSGFFMKSANQKTTTLANTVTSKNSATETTCSPPIKPVFKRAEILDWP